MLVPLSLRAAQGRGILQYDDSLKGEDQFAKPEIASAEMYRLAMTVVSCGI
jgi:hypothetical protein